MFQELPKLIVAFEICIRLPSALGSHAIVCFLAEAELVIHYKDAL